MKDQIRALEALQILDLRTMEINKNLDDFPKQISEYKQELADLQHSLDSSKEKLKEHNSEKTKMERQVSENEETIKKADQRLLEIKTHREYQALGREISEVKRQNTKFEDETLRVMESIEALETMIGELEDELSSKQQDYTARINDLEAQIAELKTEHHGLSEEKSKISVDVKKNILKAYERIKNRTGVALAEASDQTCNGCFLKIPPQLYNEIVAGEEMIQCPNCQRILFYKAEEVASA